MTESKEDARHLALKLADDDGHRVATRLAQALGVSRQVANGHLQALVADGALEAEGTTRARVYRLRPQVVAEHTFERAGLDEDRAWREAVAPHVADLDEPVRGIWHYAATEMINNAIDHSGGRTVQVRLLRNALWAELVITDDGEGIFLKIQRALSLHDPRESILELAKGKLTTAPQAHSGEGIFFTSRAMDHFEIVSHHLHFSHAPRRPDAIDEQAADVPGTVVRMRLAHRSPRRLNEVFGAYTESEDFTFDKTVVPLRLAQQVGEALVSRSQARRVCHRVERFTRVELDFAGIEVIGQGFADEVFRVFATAHPQIRLTPVNASPAVTQMIRRAVAARQAQAEGGAS